MKPNDLYKCEPVEISNRIFNLHNNLNGTIDFYSIEEENLPGLELKYYANHCKDGERVWELFSVWYLNKPVMICQVAGRSGRDHDNSFITDLGQYKLLISKLLELSTPPEEKIPVFDPDQDIENLDNFYARELSHFYDPNLKPKYEIGDVVMAMVLENHLHYSNKRVLTRVHIHRINKLNPGETYWGMQLDRRWDDKELFVPRTMIEDKDNGDVGAVFTDEDVELFIENRPLPLF